MIAQFQAEQQFANSSAKNSSQEFSSPAIVCRVELGQYEDSFNSGGSFNVSDFLQAPSSNQTAPPIPDVQEWTREMESKFRRLAEAKALNQLSLKGKVEFEKLMSLRRQLKNPRSGEDVIIEYQQKMLTRKLVNVLTEYVNFHKFPHQKRRSA